MESLYFAFFVVVCISRISLAVVILCHVVVDPTGEKPVRFPPVRQGSYPNYVNSVNLSAEVEYEKQKLRQKKEKEKLSSDNVTSKTHTPKSPSLATSLDTPPNKTKSGNQLSTSLANRSKDYLNNGVDTKENEKNYEVVAVKENLSSKFLNVDLLCTVFGFVKYE